MDCCGGKRTQWRTYTQIDYKQESAPLPSLQNPKTIYYCQGTSLIIKGAVTGYTYLFSGEEGLSVDERDIAALMETGYFVLR